jgi:hypothetical protein
MTVKLRALSNGNTNDILISPAEGSDTAFFVISSLMEVYDEKGPVERIPIAAAEEENGIFRFSGEGERFTVHSEWKLIEDVCAYIDACLVITYTGEGPGRFGLRFSGSLQGTGKPDWVIPGLFYKENRLKNNTRLYPRYDFDGGDPQKLVSDHWSFRSDRTALPAVFAWNDDLSAAFCTEEMSEIGLTGVGFLGNRDKTAIWVDFPYREEPVTFIGHKQPAPKDVQTYEFRPGQEIRLNVKIYVSSADRHSYDPFVRQMYQLHKRYNPLNPWIGLDEAAALTAHGLYRWHYHRGYRILNETAAFDRELNNNVKGLGDRKHMHVAWVSGAPYAYALLTYGRKEGNDEYVRAAIDVFDHISTALSPSGLFWASWVEGKGWGTGWNPKNTWLQARTISEATLFFLRALAFEKERGFFHPAWEQAALSNLEYAVDHQADDGNFGSYYHCETGRVEEWDGAGGILWIGALVEAYRYFQDERFLSAAVKGGRFYERFIQDEFIYGAPEDVHLTPTSEDGYNAVVSYVLLYEEDRDEKWLTLAKRAADWMLTFRWTYNLSFSKHTLLGRYDFRSRGADQASPSNQHLHNYGLFCFPEMMRLWEYTGDDYYLERTRDNLSCFLQFVAREDGDFNAYKGMVTERYYNTNCFQPKGMMLTLSHSWCVGLVLYAAQEADKYRRFLKLREEPTASEEENRFS